MKKKQPKPRKKVERYLTPVGHPRVPQERLAQFLTELSRYGNVTAAARASGNPMTTLYRYRDHDPEFAQAWEAAAKIGAYALEDEARRRAYEGWLEPAGFYRGREIRRDVIDNETGEVVDSVPAEVRKYSDTLLIFLLKGAFPEKYRERTSAKIEGDVTLHKGLDLSKLSDDELDFLRKLAAKAALPEG